VLPSLRSRFSIGLSPTRVEIVRTRQGLRTSTSAPVILTVAPPQNHAEWRPALDVFEAWLADNRVRHAELDIVVADSFVRYALIPWSEAIDKPSEAETLAQLNFETLFGVSAADWHITADMRAYGKAGIACGIEREFFLALQALCTQHGLRLRSLQPNFMRLFNRVRSRIGGDAMLVASEDGCCVFACVKGGEWLSIRSLRPEGPVDDWLPVASRREALLQGLAPDVSIHLLNAADEARASDTTA
jgi:hypothetical protein